MTKLVVSPRATDVVTTESVAADQCSPDLTSTFLFLVYYSPRLRIHYLLPFLYIFIVSFCFLTREVCTNVYGSGWYLHILYFGIINIIIIIIIIIITACFSLYLSHNSMSCSSSWLTWLALEYYSHQMIEIRFLVKTLALCFGSVCDSFHIWCIIHNSPSYHRHICI